MKLPTHRVTGGAGFMGSNLVRKLVETGTSVRVVDDLSQQVGLQPVFEGDRPGDVRHSHANIDLAHQVLGYEPRIDFVEGLRRTIEWFRGEA